MKGRHGVEGPECGWDSGDARPEEEGPKVEENVGKRGDERDRPNADTEGCRHQSRTMLDVLPQDVLELVVAHLALRDRAALCSTCRTFRDLASLEQPLRGRGSDGDGHEDAMVYAVPLSMVTGGDILTASEDFTIKLWQRGKCGKSSFRVVRTFDAHRGPVSALALQPPDGCLAVSGGANADALVWDTSTLRCVARLGGHEHLSTQLGGWLHLGGAWVSAVAWGGGSLATGDGLGQVRVWEENNFQLEGRLSVNMNMVKNIAMGGGLLAWNHEGDESFQVCSKRREGLVLQDDVKGRWKHGDGAWKMERSCASDGCVNALAMSNDGKYIASCSHRGGMHVWMTRRKPGRSSSDGADLEFDLIGVVRETMARISAVAFSPDARVLATGNSDGTVTLRHVGWRTWCSVCDSMYALCSCSRRKVKRVALEVDGKLRHASKEDAWSDVWSVSFGSDGRSLVSCCMEKFVMWNLA